MRLVLGCDLYMGEYGEAIEVLGRLIHRETDFVLLHNEFVQCVRAQLHSSRSGHLVNFRACSIQRKRLSFDFDAIGGGD